MRTDSVFWIASMSKPITATALMMLVDEGKVKLDDPVSKYLPEFAEQWLAVEKDKDHILLKKPKQATLLLFPVSTILVSVSRLLTARIQSVWQ
jgi:CubicO group peptidase (beta-lactamase class C family)